MQRLRGWLRSQFASADRPQAEMQADIQHAQDVLLFWRSQRTHRMLLERYNPAAGMEVDEKIRLSARRVGLELPKDIKDRIK